MGTCLFLLSVGSLEARLWGEGLIFFNSDLLLRLAAHIGHGDPVYVVHFEGSRHLALLS